MVLFGGARIMLFGLLVAIYCILDIIEESDNTDKRNRGEYYDNIG